LPIVALKDEALVMVGGSSTVRVKAWLAAPAELAALNVRGQTFPVPVAGVPEMVAVPLLLAVNFNPEGRVPDRATVGVG